MLVRDARYYCFRGVEQRLVRCRISSLLGPLVDGINGGGGDGAREEIEIGLEDVRQSGISFLEDAGRDGVGKEGVSGEVHYARPFVDDVGRRLALEVGGKGVVRVVMDCDGIAGEASFWGETATKMRRLVGVVGMRTGLPLPDSAGRSEAPFNVRCTIDSQADVFVDGKRWDLDNSRDGEDAMVLGQGGSGWMVKKSQWRIKAAVCQAGRLELSLEAAKIEAYSSERAMNNDRGFL